MALDMRQPVSTQCGYVTAWAPETEWDSLTTGRGANAKAQFWHWACRFFPPTIACLSACPELSGQSPEVSSNSQGQRHNRREPFMGKLAMARCRTTTSVNVAECVTMKLLSRKQCCARLGLYSLRVIDAEHDYGLTAPVRL